MEYRVINQNTPWEEPELHRPIKVGIFDVTKAIQEGTQKGIAKAFLEEKFHHGLVYKDFYNYLENFTPKFRLARGKEGLFDEFMVEEGLMEKKFFRYHLTSRALYIIGELNSPNRV